MDEKPTEFDKVKLPDGHLPALDLFRGIAILGVLVAHCTSNWPGVHGFILSQLEKGGYGVDLFFMVSGFTLCHSVTREESKFGSVHWRNFYLRRFFRISPLFFAAAVYFQFNDPFGADPRWAPDGRGIFDYVIFFSLLHGFWLPAISIVPGGWSIGAEWFFYLLFGMLWKHLRSAIGSAFMFVLAIQFGFFFRCGVVAVTHALNVSDQRWIHWIDLSPPGRCGAFFLGIFLYALARRVSFENHRPALVAIAAMWFGCALYRTLPLAALPLNVISSLGFGALILAFYRAEPLPRSWQPVAFLGRISFSIYVVHFAVLSWTRTIRQSLEAIHPVIGVFAYLMVVLSLSCLVSTLTWKWLETPGINVGKKLQVQRQIST